MDGVFVVSVDVLVAFLLAVAANAAAFKKAEEEAFKNSDLYMDTKEALAVQQSMDNEYYARAAARAAARADAPFSAVVDDSAITFVCVGRHLTSMTFVVNKPISEVTPRGDGMIVTTTYSGVGVKITTTTAGYKMTVVFPPNTLWSDGKSLGYDTNDKVVFDSLYGAYHLVGGDDNTVTFPLRR